MESTRFPSGLRRWMLTACVLTACWSGPAQGQIAALKKIAESQAPAAPAPQEKPDEARARLEQWLQAARDTLARLEAPAAATTLPVGITPDELEARRRNLEQIVITATRLIKSLSACADARKDLENSRAEDAAWTGFQEKPPYSLLVVDELLNERDAIKAKLASCQSSLSNFEGLLTTTVAETKASEEVVSNLIVAAQHATEATLDAVKWRLEAARGISRQLAARAASIQSNSETLRDRIAAATIDLALVDRKVRIAKASARFSDEDLAKIAKLSEAHKQGLRKEKDVVAKRLKSALAARAQAQAALDAVASASPADKDQPAGLELAKFRLEVTEGRVESLQFLTEGLDGLTQIENLQWQAYQNRQVLLKAATPAERDKMLDALETLLKRAQVSESVLNNEMAGSNADLSKLESRAISISSEDPRFSLLNEQRAAKSESLAMLQRISQAVITHRKQLDRWVAEYAPAPQEQGILERASTVSKAGGSALKKIWSYEVMSFEDKIVVQGQTITGTIPVTLGMLVRALLFFLIGYVVFSRLAQRIQHSLVTRGHIAEAQARTLRNWAMIVIGVFLAVGTLSFLKIPLTVFAFFGGALAIGLGFGMQTLIKNFISGIIVLAERKVRVGDVLDVEGIIGTVIEINTRSSILRSSDEVETMIPNSLFLEKRVTNRTLSSAKMRRSLRVGAAYGSSPQKVMEILSDAATRHGLVLKSPAPFAVLDDFGDSALIFSLYFWLELKGGTNAMIVASDLRLMIEKRFAEAGVSLPFPQRDVRLATEHPLQIEWLGVPPDR
ncbi:MAG: mechanosensitive ion channel domain-containing protein [Verrucomicrobiota bacterium]